MPEDERLAAEAGFSTEELTALPASGGEAALPNAHGEDGAE
jgi:hypothetical protein